MVNGGIESSPPSTKAPTAASYAAGIIAGQGMPGIGLAKIVPADLDVPFLGQLAAAQLTLGDAFEPGPVEVVRLNTALRGGPLR